MGWEPRRFLSGASSVRSDCCQAVGG
ncbi:hypothetical protein ABZ491_13280 [Micromonospora rifamycinica]